MLGENPIVKYTEDQDKIENFICKLWVKERNRAASLPAGPGST